MAEEFSLINLEHLCSWVLKEYDKSGQIFGITEELFFKPSSDDPFRMQRYDRLLETPLGVAAGPHTQMAQNIIASWLCGARYIELKTVQTLDEIEVLKPCIDMYDEGYNCEWSQELKLKDSFNEYLNAWILIHVLRHKLGIYDSSEHGFIFNMSVGYNLEGILKSNVQQFLDMMADCSKLLDEKLKVVKRFYPQIDEIDIPATLSDNVTLSTMHGCPPDEVEKIAMYLVNERGYHTTIKLNPTLLGPERLRHILNDRLGFDTPVPDLAFEHDLKFNDAVNIINNLKSAASKKQVDFNLKLTNTLESCNFRNVFAKEAEMMYMSGRSLHPISINLADRLQQEFNGELDISFSAGADCFNLHNILAAGIKPVTVCSDILKPGGYGRLVQYLENVRSEMKAENASDIEQFICNFADCDDAKQAAMINLRRYAGAIVNNKAYHKSSKQSESVKTDRKLNHFDCVHAPCISTCPAGQDIPSYMYYTSTGDYKKAFEVIMRNNPLPEILGMVCDHQCQYKCTRTNYDNSLLIREIKRFVTANSPEKTLPELPAANGKKVAIIGAGPSGLSAAYFLRLSGFAVEIFETRAFSGGMAADAIPEFRLTAEAIDRDVEYIKNLGVKFNYDQKIDKNRFSDLRRSFDYVYVAIGAQKAKKMNIPGEEAHGVFDQLNFLSDVRRKKPVKTGRNIVVIGGGNSAMDAARTAWRLADDAKTTVVYRRTQSQMPADKEEIEALLEEGIEILPLHQPLEILTENGHVKALKCQKMKLGEPDSSGRRRPLPIEGEFATIDCDTIIEAIGQDMVADFADADDLITDAETGMTRISDVFAGGDAVRGASTIVLAVGDGQKAANNIINRAISQGLELKPQVVDKGLDYKQFQVRNAQRLYGQSIPETQLSKRRCFDMVTCDLTEEQAKAEAERCLYCNDYCNVCVTVCPNRANYSYMAETADYMVQRAVFKKGKYKIENESVFKIEQKPQVINIGDFCNECGNCTAFCPTSGEPYRDKPKFYLNWESFKPEKDGYCFSNGALYFKNANILSKIEEREDALHFSQGPMHARLKKNSLEVFAVEPKGEKPTEYSFLDALKMAILFKALSDAPFRSEF